MATAPVRPKGKIPRSDYALYRTVDAKRLRLIVHGLGGDGDEGYWANLAQMLRYEPTLIDTDICFWGYPSGLNPFANAFSLIRRGRSFSSVPELARSLATCIDSLVDEFRYEEVSIAGHSLGGSIGLLCSEYILEETKFLNVRHICLMSTPQNAPKIARAASNIFRWNPHIRWLGSPEVKQLFSVCLPNMRNAGLHATYVHYDLDEVVQFIEDAIFDRRLTCHGSHGWPSDITNPNQEPYRILLRWLANPARTDR